MTHFFSHVRLQATARQDAWLRDLMRHGEPYHDHALIWRLFPGDGVERDFIFRRLEDERSFYVVSARPPQGDSGLFQVQSKAYSPQLAVGQTLRFDLRANPTVSVRQQDGRSRRHDVLMHAKRQLREASHGGQADALAEAGRQWLLERAEQWGVTVDAGSVLQSGYRQQRLRRKGKAIEYSTLDYSGVLHVTDPDRLQRALCSGVGHSKGFGCGLLLVRPLV